MANEIVENVSFAYEDSLGVLMRWGVTNRKRNSTARQVASVVQSVGTSEEALLLGDTTAPFSLGIRNLDPTNFVNVKVATGGAIFARLDPDTNQDGTGGWLYLARAGSGAQAPFVIADTAACRVEVLTAPA